MRKRWQLQHEVELTSGVVSFSVKLRKSPELTVGRIMAGKGLELYVCCSDSETVMIPVFKSVTRK
jgi:hypothetical protein